MTEYHIPRPDQRVYFKENRTRNVNELGTIDVPILIGIEYEPSVGGILCHKTGQMLPTKGFIYPEALVAINSAKSLFIDSIMLLKKPQVWPLLLGLAISPFKSKVKFLDKLLHIYNRTLYKYIISPHLFQKQYLTEIARELQEIIEKFLLEIGIDPNNAKQFADTFSAMIQFDNVYRHEMQDVFTEMSQAKLVKNPAKELRRVLKIYCKRELAPTIRPKFKMLATLLSLTFWSRPIKKAFIKVITECNFKNLQFDPIDRYNVLNRGDYNYFGKTWEERNLMQRQLHGDNLPYSL